MVGDDVVDGIVEKGPVGGGRDGIGASARERREEDERGGEGAGRRRDGKRERRTYDQRSSRFAEDRIGGQHFWREG